MVNLYQFETYKPIKKLIKRKVKFPENYGYAPIVYIRVQRLKKYKHFPRFTFRKGEIYNDHFIFYHEPYSKRNFHFNWQIILNDAMLTFDEGTGRIAIGNLNRSTL